MFRPDPRVCLVVWRGPGRCRLDGLEGGRERKKEREGERERERERRERETGVLWAG